MEISPQIFNNGISVTLLFFLCRKTVLAKQIKVWEFLSPTTALPKILDLNALDSNIEGRVDSTACFVHVLSVVSSLAVCSASASRLF